MKVLWIAKRDLSANLNGIQGWVVIASVLTTSGILFNLFGLNGSERLSHEVLQQFFFTTGGVFNFAAILFAMRSFSEEKANGTDVLLETSPISDGSIVFGKWLAVMGMLTLLAALSTYMPALIFVNGKVSIGHIITGYVGMLGMSGAIAALGVFTSSLTKSQVAAALLGAVVAGMFLLGFNLSSMVEPPFVDIVERFGMYNNNYMPFIEGRMPTRELVFFGSVIFGALFLTTRILEGRRFR